MAKKPEYMEAHPGSELGDPNVAYERGWKLVAIRPNGLMVYRRKHPVFGVSVFGLILAFEE